MILNESISDRERREAFVMGQKGNKKLMFALNNWLGLKNKDFSLNDAFQCIYNACEGNNKKIAKTIEALTTKDKVQGRSSTVWGGPSNNFMDIVREGGQIVLKGTDAPKLVNKVGQHHHDNPKIFKKDGTVKKTVDKTEEIYRKLCDKLREIYPDADNQYITHAAQAIRNYDAQQRDGMLVVADRVAKGVLVLDDTGGYNNFKIVRNPNRPKRQRIGRKVATITEAQMKAYQKAIKLTEYKFYNNINRFIADLLKDPVNAELPSALKANGFKRNVLIKQMLSLGLVQKTEKIVDKDNDGNPKTAQMRVKYSAPKKDHNNKLKKLYIRTVGKNVPQKVNEDGEGGCAAGATNCDSSGSFVQPLFGVQRRKMPVDISETTATTNTGNYEYTVPFGGDKETLARGNGKGGSNSIYTLDEAAHDGFSYEYLAKLRSFAARKLYCDDYLGDVIGCGSSRAVYQINDQLCLKLAINDKGIAQNEEEATQAHGGNVPAELVPKVFAEASDMANYTYIIAEYVLPAQEEDFQQIWGISFDDFQELLIWVHDEIHPEEWCPTMMDDYDAMNLISNGGEIGDFCQYVARHDVPVGDLIRIENWGMVKRYNKVQMVLLDNGLTEEIFMKHYR